MIPSTDSDADPCVSCTWIEIHTSDTQDKNTNKINY